MHGDDLVEMVEGASAGRQAPRSPADGRVVHVHPRRTLATRRSPSAPPGEAAGWGSEDRTEEVLGLVIGCRGGESERAEDGRGGGGEAPI